VKPNNQTIEQYFNHYRQTLDLFNRLSNYYAE